MLGCRINRIREIVRREELDAVLLLGLANIRYCCGFTGTDGALLVTRDRVVFLTDSRYTAQAESEVGADEIRQYRAKVAGVVQCIVELGVLRVGFEAGVVTVAMHQKFQSEGSLCSFIALGDQLNVLREVKDDAELVSLEHAAQLNADAFEAVLPLIVPGVSEQEIAFELECALRRLGGEDKAFDLIVASGERGALPHGVATDKLIQVGELVTIDFGTRCKGYHSDETVTVAIGDISEELRQIYDVVLEAHDLALEALTPSVKASEIDAIARQYIEQKGFGAYFGHGLGHGVGLEVHETPTLSPRSEAFLTTGMVFTIEPGIYIPDVGGVRIEDTVVMTVDGYRRLTKIPKAFRRIDTI